MARKNKIGLDYFSHDVEMFNDIKIKFIKAKHGLIGYAVFLRLLENIYKENGYFIQIDDKFNILFADDNKLDINVYINVLNDCINENLFNKEMYEKFGILTSKRIQLNFLAGAERRKLIEFDKRFLMLSSEILVNDNIKIIDVNINSENDNISTQKEIERENEIKKKKENKHEEKETEIKKPSVDVETFFTECWKLYPNKVGIGSIKEKAKKNSHKLGEEFKRCIERYIVYVENRRKTDFKDLKYQNGSTFWNSGHVDFLDKNYQEVSSVKSREQLNKESEEQYGF